MLNGNQRKGKVRKQLPVTAELKVAANPSTHEVNVDPDRPAFQRAASLGSEKHRPGLPHSLGSRGKENIHVSI